MRKIKIFLIFLMSTIILLSSYYILKINSMTLENQVSNNISNIDNESKNNNVIHKIELKDAKSLKDAISATNRINTVLLGTDGERTDTIIFLSYDVDNKLADIMSIPRDTYIDVSGYDRYDQHKINAVYNFKNKDGGADGVKSTVSQILSVPIHYYAKVDYSGVKQIVDIVGGVEVNITQNMYYDDPTSKPPLHINFKKGNYLLKGQKAIDYLRWRKNNDGSGSGSDLDRNSRQIEFLKTLMKKSINSGKIANIAKVAYNSIDTDMTLENLIYYLTNLGGFNIEKDLKSHVLPGKAKLNVLSYYFHDPYETEQLMFKIYTRCLNVDNEIEGERKDEFKEKKLDEDNEKNKNLNNK